MTVGVTGARTSLSDTNLTPRSISDVINMIDWQNAPLLNLLGLNSESKFKLLNWPSTKAEIIEDTMSPFTCVSAAGLADNTDTTIAMYSGHGIYFRQGDIVLVDTEQLLVVSVSGDTLTVVRAHGSSTRAAHDSGATYTIVGRAMPEGSDPVLGHTTTTTSPYNYSQIISEAVRVTKTEQAIMKYGIQDTMDYQVAKLFAESGRAGKLAQLLAKSFYYGKRVIRAAAPAYGFMGGFPVFVTTNVTALASAPLQKSDIHTKIRAIVDAGGKCDVLVTGSWGMEKINSMYESTISTQRSERTGGGEITTIITPMGKVEVVFDWMCPAGNAYFINRDKCGWLTVRPFAMSEIRDDGDYFVTDVVGEFSFMVANELSHGIITGFSTTS
jgi:hypothetical protein